MSQPESEQLMQDPLRALNTMPAILGGGAGLVSQGWVYELPGKSHLEEWSQNTKHSSWGTAVSSCSQPPYLGLSPQHYLVEKE